MSRQSSGVNVSPWEETLERKKDDLSRILVLLERKRQRGKISSIPVASLDDAVQLKDVTLFQAAVQRIATQFTSKNVSRFVAEYLYPKLDYVRQFSNGVASAVQFDPTGTGSLVFGLLFVVIQVRVALVTVYCFY